MKFFSGKNRKEQLVEEILLENYNRYYRLAYSYVHQDADAADIVQNGAYRAIRSCQSLKEEAFASTWVYRIMLNEIFRFQKLPAFVSLEESGEEQGQEDVYENLDLKQAMDALDARDKTVVELRYYEDMKLDEIAQVLQENVSTVKSRLYRSMKKLRLQLEE